MPGERAKQSARFHVPDLHRFIIRSGRHLPAIRTVSDEADEARVTQRTGSAFDSRLERRPDPRYAIHRSRNEEISIRAKLPLIECAGIECEIGYFLPRFDIPQDD